MKLAIVSDLHLGHRQYRTEDNGFNKFEQIGYRVFNKNIELIKACKPDLLINAGDTFDVANPPVNAIKKYFAGMAELENIPDMTILGNHDFSFQNRKASCSAVALLEHTYFADYEIKEVVIDDILFVMMPYIFDTDENIDQYLKACETIAKKSTCKKKILITHGVTDRYYRENYINDPIHLSDALVKCFNLVIIGHIHTPFHYYEGKTLVISPGGMIDYQADEDHTGPIILDTDTMKFERKFVKTPHIIKLNCDSDTINDALKSVTENIYHITYTGNLDTIDHDLFIEAQRKSVNLVIDVAAHTDSVDDTQASTSLVHLDLYEWVKANYPNHYDLFVIAKKGVSINDTAAKGI